MQNISFSALAHPRLQPKLGEEITHSALCEKGRTLLGYFLLSLLFLGGIPRSVAGPYPEPGSEEWKNLFDPPYTKPTELPKDSALRKKLFDLLRPKIEKEAKRAVLFEGSLMAFRNWAVFIGRAVDAKGNSVKMGDLENSDVAGLWLRTESGWQVVESSGGHSDAFYLIWSEKYGVPKELLNPESEPGKK